MRFTPIDSVGPTRNRSLVRVLATAFAAMSSSRPRSPSSASTNESSGGRTSSNR